MDASLFISKTGLDAQQRRMSVISNNLANVSTTGFKRERAVFEDLLVPEYSASWWTDWCRYTGSHWVAHGYWNKSFSK